MLKMFYLEKILNKEEQKILNTVLQRLNVKLKSITDVPHTFMCYKFSLDSFAFDDMLGEKISGWNNKKCSYKGLTMSTIDMIQKVFNQKESNVLLKLIL